MAEVPLFIPDASSTLRWLLPYREYHPQARAMIEDYLSGRVSLLAPYHFPAEVGGGLRKAIAGRSITYQQGRERFLEFHATAIPIRDVPDLPIRAFENCQRYSLTFKDALYVTLAQEFQVPLITTDMRMINALGRFPYKTFLADYRIS